MNAVTPFALAILGGLITLIGYFVSNTLERRRTLRLREMEFRLDRYKEFLLAFSELHGNPTYETQLRFVNGVNSVLLIGSSGLLQALKDLVDNYNNPDGTARKQELILQQILSEMRRDLNAPDAQRLIGFEFPIIVPDLNPRARSDAPTSPQN